MVESNQVFLSLWDISLKLKWSRWEFYDFGVKEFTFLEAIFTVILLLFQICRKKFTFLKLYTMKIFPFEVVYDIQWSLKNSI